MAADTPRYEPVPSWVQPAPPIRQGDQGSPFMAILDQQTRIADGAVWEYHENASRAISGEALARMGTVALNWQPFHGDLIIHRVEILRDGQRIDALKDGNKFTVIRREQSLENLEMNGILTATLEVEGLRIGDVLDVAFSISVKDPALNGGAQTGLFAMSQPYRADFARARLLWPTGTPIRWKSYPVGLTPVEIEKAGWHELDFPLPAPKQPDVPADAPKRFQTIQAIEASSFADWNAVSAVFAPLYRTNGLITPNGALAQEIAKIRTTETDPKRRVAAALSLVQDRIRYFANGMNGGNYTPQAPEKTWSAGYGDCKAKTLLLLAILHELGIEAEPVLANIGGGDFVAGRLPAPEAFNHILVHATVGGADLWLDGTDRGTRIEDLGDVPPFRTVLPVREGGVGLLTLPFRAPARPTRTVSLDIDDSAGIGLPAPFSATIQFRGSAADLLRAATAQMDNEKLLGLALFSLSGAAGADAVPITQKIDFDTAASTATISVTGITILGWKRQDHVYRFRPGSGITRLALKSDRSRPAWTNIPITMGDPNNALITTRLHLPNGGQGISLEGDPVQTLDLAGRHIVDKVSLAGNLLTIEEQEENSGAELPAAELPGAREKLAALQARPARLSTSVDYPPIYRQIVSARHDRKLDSLAALFTARIAAKPEETSRYVSRAAFFINTYQRPEALADLDKAIVLDGNAPTYLRRAELYEALGDKQKAVADFQAVLNIDPTSKPAFERLGLLQIDLGQKDVAMTAVDQRLAGADEDKPEWLAIKAEFLHRAGDANGALAAMDQAITTQPANAVLLNARCWIKATLSVQLDGAVQDCTRAIELADNNVQALNSRALAYFRLNRLEEALADISAALDRAPAFASSIYLRAVIERKMGKNHEADEDVANALMISPRVEEEFARWKIKA